MFLEGLPPDEDRVRRVLGNLSARRKILDQDRLEFPHAIKERTAQHEKDYITHVENQLYSRYPGVKAPEDEKPDALLVQKFVYAPWLGGYAFVAEKNRICRD